MLQLSVIVRTLTATLALLLLATAACGDDDDSPADTPSATPATSSPSGNLKPPDSDSPAAGVCPGPSSGEVTIDFQSGIPSPRCVRVLPDATLRIVNSTAEAVDFELGAFAGTLQPSNAATSDQTVGDFLAPGVHVIMSTAYGQGAQFGGSGEVWLVEDDESAAYKLIIHRSDGSEDVYHLTAPPIVCGQLNEGDIIELCGTTGTHAVDFIQVNESLGESYEVIEE